MKMQYIFTHSLGCVFKQQGFENVNTFLPQFKKIILNVYGFFGVFKKNVI